MKPEYKRIYPPSYTDKHDPKCPSCGSDWVKLEADLLSELERIEWPNPLFGTFLGKSERQVKAETIINKCDQCKEHFKKLREEKEAIK